MGRRFSSLEIEQYLGDAVNSHRIARFSVYEIAE
jgi:hypothetical protein